MPPTPLSKSLKVWKETWDVFVSDPEFRNYFLNGTSGDYTVRPNSRVRITKNFGTIRIPGGRSEDHFVAYRKSPNGGINIFDSADTSGRYNSFLSGDVIRSVARMASTNSVRLLPHHPQCHDNDTFCQTWSLAWLKPSLRKYVIGVRSPSKSAENIYKICHAIANSSKFAEYMRYNEPAFTKVINKIHKKYRVQQTPMAVEEFILNSKHISRANIKDVFGF
jgi:hypothetical protein